MESINKSTIAEKAPTNDDDENELHKAWTIEMLTNDGDISMSMMNEVELISEDDKKFLYARAVHSNHLIHYHMHQIIEQQKVVNEYRSMTMEGRNLTPLESNLNKYDLVIISQIWHHKMFESVLSNLWNMQPEGIHKFEKEQEKEEEKPIKKMEKSKHEEEHAEPTLNIGN